ncbi:hypothetical protein [Brucella anthropi]|uniref:hypothetical protein n=1 Tax=Brucella anthropi TaxID=529 RepID=UPI00124C2040|nr:hypothetical protein [Brucella anthropi]KAB2724135.1 hypothetical protein F9K76_20215 [Brucella anthropi]KAB2739668.1 hypothetical protein F9K74_18370 [Brucella anthropi]KAB2802027.1 hypothetical protein F9K83_18365 [Brucella anthropi]
MVAILLPNVGYRPSRPKLNEPVSMSASGQRAISFIEYADAFWTVTMTTDPLKANDLMLVEGFQLDARNGMQTIIYSPTTVCIPQAYWGQPDHPHVLNNGYLQSIQNAQILTIASVEAGLKLQRNDYLSLTTGDYHSLHRVSVGGTATSGGILTVSVWPPVMTYIEVGATVTFKNPKMNSRLVVDSFSLTEEAFPVASWQLIEVPR